MGNIFINKINRFITEHHLADKTCRVIVGLSGGADSVALLAMMHCLGYDILAAHCNFHLRGEESDRDEQFCRLLCDSLHIPFVKRDFDVAMQREATGESVEMACRTLRYEWWESMIRDGRGEVVAVGHHREDDIETFFLNLLRGSGIAGLKGMMPKSGNIIRPMLDVTRAEIEEYLAVSGLGYVTDHTNLENDFSRNRLRNIIMPELQRLFPGAADGIATSVACLKDNYGLYTDAVETLRRKYVEEGGVIDLSRLITTEPHPSIVLYELLSPLGINMTQVKNMLGALDENGRCLASGLKFSSPSISFLLDRGHLIPMAVTDASVDDCSVELDSPPFSMRRITRDEFTSVLSQNKDNRYCVYFDATILDGSPEFHIRSWRKSDRISPFGMKGSRLVSDIFSDAKIPVDKKESIPLLLRGDLILWIVGMRASRHFAVTDKTKEVIVVEYHPETSKKRS